MKIKIDVSKFLKVKKPIEVEDTVKNARLSYETYSSVMGMVEDAKKASEFSQNNVLNRAGEAKEIFDHLADNINICENFLVSFLKLNKTQASSLEDLNEGNLYELVAEVSTQFNSGKNDELSETENKLKNNDEKN